MEMGFVYGLAAYLEFQMLRIIGLSLNVRLLCAYCFIGVNVSVEQYEVKVHRLH